jgi:hypothetical protein
LSRDDFVVVLVVAPVVARPERGITETILRVPGSMMTISSCTTTNFLPRYSG